MWSALRAISRLCAFSLLEMNLNSHESDWVTTRAFLLRKSRFVDSQITRMELLAKFSFIVLAFPPNHKFTMCRRSLSTLIAPTTLHNARQCLSHKSFLAYLHITLSLSANPPKKKNTQKNYANWWQFNKTSSCICEMFVTWVACLMSRGAVRPYASSSRCQSAEFVNRNRPGCALSTTALLSDFVNGCGTAEKCVTAVREKREKFKPQNHEMAHEATEETRKLLHWIISFCFISFCFSLFFTLLPRFVLVSPDHCGSIQLAWIFATRNCS